MMRFHPCLQRIHQILDRGQLGAVLWAFMEGGSFVPSWHAYEDYGELYAVRQRMGGGVILTESHELDLATWFFGRPRQLAATGGKLTEYEGDAEDTAGILLDYGFPVHINLCFMQRPPSRNITIVLEHGRIEWHGDARLEIYEENSGWVTVDEAPFDRENLFRDEVEHFLRCMGGEETPLVSVSEGAESLTLALEALRQIRGE